MEQEKPILKIENLQISFEQYDGGFTKTTLETIKDLTLEVRPGEILAVVGSSGSGKSLLAHAVLGILPYNASVKGKMEYCGEELSQKKAESLRGNEIVLVPQSVAFLDPLMKIGSQIRKGKKDPESKKKLNKIFESYHLKEEVQDLYPFELSGGMNRRVLVSTAMMGEPKLVIADEPTPGLHMSMVKRVMEHFREMADKGAGVLLITHDLEQAIEIADRIAVFYAGTTVEEASVEDFHQRETLRHPYTKALFDAMPKNGFQFIKGSQPYVKDMKTGCPFGPRCKDYSEACNQNIPYRSLRNGKVRCICAD